MYRFFIESVTSRLDQEYSTNSVVQMVTFGSQVQIQHHNDYISEAVQQSTVKYWTQRVTLTEGLLTILKIIHTQAPL